MSARPLVPGLAENLLLHRFDDVAELDLGVGADVPGDRVRVEFVDEESGARHAVLAVRDEDGRHLVVWTSLSSGWAAITPYDTSVLPSTFRRSSEGVYASTVSTPSALLEASVLPVRRAEVVEAWTRRHEGRLGDLASAALALGASDRGADALARFLTSPDPWRVDVEYLAPFAEAVLSGAPLAWALRRVSS